jgi:hypothetical protein
VRSRLGSFRTRALGRYAGGLGFDLVRRGFYSPLPAVHELPPEVWTRRSPLEGIHFDSAEQLGFVKESLAQYIPEFDARFDTGTSFGRYDIRNLAYDEVDSELLYAFVRFLRPARVVELGSGFSSLVLARACEVNRKDGTECAYEIFDPFPQPWVRELDATLREAPAQDVPMEVFDSLAENDILFVDTTHTVKVGSEVNRIVLDVLPRLRPGVVVQFHDIFLPWEYHRHWIEGDWKWNEQYLVQAFLSMNPGVEILASCQALVREQRAELAKLIPTLRELSAPSAFWIRRR